MCHRHCEEPLRRSNPAFFVARWIASSLPPSLDELRRTVAPRNDGGESAPHSHPSSPGLTGRPSIPETPENNREARGVLDRPVKPDDDNRISGRGKDTAIVRE